MQPVFSIGVLDSPWVVLAFLVGSALINWLTRRRAEKAREREGGMPPPPAPEYEQADPAPIDPDIERALRRLLGQEAPPVERPMNVPPPPVVIPPPIRTPLAPPPLSPETVPTWGRIKAAMEGEDPTEGESEGAPLLAATIARRSALAHVEEAHVRPMSAMGRRLRDPRAAREAWKMSVILGPPRALES